MFMRLTIKYLSQYFQTLENIICKLRVSTIGPFGLETKVVFSVPHTT
jgi:hypothetical protein